jgi:hypothetical protein
LKRKEGIYSIKEIIILGRVPLIRSPPNVCMGEWFKPALKGIRNKAVVQTPFSWQKKSAFSCCFNILKRILIFQKTTGKQEN